MEEANLIVKVKIDPKRRKIEKLGAEAETGKLLSKLRRLQQLNGQGAANLMAGSDRQILEAAGAVGSRSAQQRALFAHGMRQAMAQEGWEAECCL